MSRNTLLRNSTIYALGDIFPKLFSFISFPILTTYLAPDDYAIVNYVNTVNIFLTIVSFLCLNTYYLVYYYRVGNAREQAKLLGNLSVFVVGLNILCTLVVYVIGPRLFHTLESNIDFYPYIAIGIATNFFNIFGILPSALFRVQERPMPLTILNILKGAFTLALTLILVVGFDYKALGVLYSSLFVSIGFAVVFIWITLRHMVWTFDWKQLKHALLFSLPLVPGSLAYYMVSMSDRIFIDKYLNLFDLGIYSTASTLALLLNIISYGAYKAFEPYFFKIYGQTDFDKKFQQVFDGYLLLMLIGAIGIGVYAKEFFRIFANEQYLISYWYVPLVLIGVVATAVRMLFGTVLTAQSRTKVSSLITIIGGCVSVGLNVLLLRYMGIVAACISSAVSTCLMFLLSVYYAKIDVRLGNPFLAMLVSALLIWFSVYVLSIDSIWLSLFIKTGIVAGGVCLISKILHVNLLKYLLSLFKVENV